MSSVVDMTTHSFEDVQASEKQLSCVFADANGVAIAEMKLKLKKNILIFIGDFARNKSGLSKAQ